ncbi:MAG: CotH kinase family protein, partial [Chitinophagales bacterium]|nr:CotH kinase family protein [Chitinophagales bacterium]
VRRSSFINLFINNELYGLYLNIEEMDEIFIKNRFGENTGNLYKCTYPVDLNYLGDDQNTYKNISGAEERAYALQTNEQQDDYSDLVEFISILNNTPDDELPCALEKIFHVDNFLKIYALDIASGHWDNYGYNKNNFFLYHNQFTGRFEFLSYDCDNTFGVDWLGKDWSTRDIYAWQISSEYRPLAERLLDIPVYKNRFSFYMQQIVNEYLQEDAIFTYIDSLKEFITPSAFLDMYKGYDYGYTNEDFLNAFDTDDIDGHTPFGVKNFILYRNENTNTQLEINDITPVIDFANYTPLFPGGSSTLTISAEITDDQTDYNAQLFYSSDQINFVAAQMFDDGTNGDTLAYDNVYTCQIITPESEELYYYISATDNAAQTSYEPFCGTYNLALQYTRPTLVINECMAINQSTIADEFAEFEDYIEIYNTGEFAIYIGDKFLSDEFDNPSKWRLPEIMLAGDQYLIIWADDEIFETTYHSSFKLNGDGDQIGIFDNIKSNFSMIDTISFAEQTGDISIGRLPNGTGPFVQLPVPSPAENNEKEIIDSTFFTTYIILTNNPSFGHSDLIVSTDFDTEGTMELYASDGQKQGILFDDVISRGITNIAFPTHQYPAGIYLLRITINNKTSVFKLSVF